MSKWIDADEAEKLLRAGCAYAIWELPSIDIVFCKECKHWHKKDTLTYCDRVDYGYGHKADDFCSYGERNDNGSDN